LEDVTYAVLLETSLPTTALLSASDLNPVHGVQEVCSSYRQLHTLLYLVCQSIVSGMQHPLQFRALTLTYIVQ